MTSVRECSVEQAGARVTTLRNSQVLQATPHTVGLIALSTGTQTLSHQGSKLIHFNLYERFLDIRTCSLELLAITRFTWEFPRCPHFIRDTDSLVVKEANS